MLVYRRVYFVFFLEIESFSASPGGEDNLREYSTSLGGEVGGLAN